MAGSSSIVSGESVAFGRGRPRIAERMNETERQRQRQQQHRQVGTCNDQRPPDAS
jgi:hypothetical protein